MTEEEKLAKKLIVMGENGDPEPLWDAFCLCKEIEKMNSTVVVGKNNTDRDEVIFNPLKFDIAHRLAKAVRGQTSRVIRNGDGTDKHVDLYKACLLFEAPYSLDEAIIYAEFNRPYAKKFYEPRRKQLLPVVQAMQRLEERKKKITLLMMPPGVGKSTVEIMFQRWSGGRHPELGILMGSHSNSLLQGAYNEMLRMCDPNGEYLWNDIFPNAPLAGTDAKNLRIDLEKRKRFETFQYSSVGSGNAGKVRASNLLCIDDIVDGIETAMNRDRLDKLWQQFTTDYLQRTQGDCGLLVVATPWSIHDPIDKLAEIHSEDPECEIIRFPALNENDESNFDYPQGLGFTTSYYHEQRSVMDDASWRALYMMQPVEREGTLYPRDELRRYFTLPEGKPDAVYAVCDTKTKGADYAVMPIAYQYGQDFYIEDVVCENYAPDVVETSLVNMLCKHSPHMACFESNAAGGTIAANIQRRINERGCKTSISTKWTQANKETKIQVESPWVKTHCLFKDDSVIKSGDDKEYRNFLNMLTGYTMSGKNNHDDVPDAMAQLSQFVQGMAVSTVEVYRRPF